MLMKVHSSDRKIPGMPEVIRMPEGCEQRAQMNHSQTLSRLNERGGIGICEAAAIIENRKWAKMTNDEKFVWLAAHPEVIT